MHLVRRQTCRVCGSPALTKVIDLGMQYLQGAFVKPGKEDPPLRQFPTELVRCDPSKHEAGCGLLQMAHSVPPEILYSAYWYRSGTNATMRNHLQGIAQQAVSLVNREDCTVLDIGCNDGTLLSCYPDGFARYGIDPSDVAQQVKGDIVVIQDLFPSAELSRILDGKKFDIITSIAMFYDLEDPVQFARSVRAALAPAGIWIFEMSYMPTMLEQNSYDTICHEHLEYYSLAVLENILARAGMALFNVSLNSINGGSIRCFAAHQECLDFCKPEFRANISELHKKEFELELDTDKPYLAFQNRVTVLRDELKNLLSSLHRQGKRIHIYGASTKGNTILQWCGIDHRVIDFAAERNPDKYGARTLGSDIPIISEADSRAMKPDYYLVLPWHFQEEFLQREKATIEQGTAFIFPLPRISIIGGDSLEQYK